MTSMPSGDKTYCEGLKELDRSTFPRACPKCGRPFADLAEFLRETVEPTGSTGLSAYNLDRTIVAVYRNCKCQSTLMVVCQDRRDRTPAGLKRRQLFDRLVNHLQSAGLSASEARQEVLNLLRGEANRVVEVLGANPLIQAIQHPEESL